MAVSWCFPLARKMGMVMTCALRAGPEEAETALSAAILQGWRPRGLRSAWGIMQTRAPVNPNGRAIQSRRGVSLFECSVAQRLLPRTASAQSKSHSYTESLGSAKDAVSKDTGP